MSGTGFAWKVQEWVKEIKMKLEIFAPAVLICPIPPWCLSEPQIDFTMNNKIQKGEI